VIKALLGLVLIMLLSAGGYSVNQRGEVATPNLTSAPPPGYYAVTKVSDGDTFNVSIAGKNETVRLVGIDTPETHDPRKPVQCFGKVASDKAHELLDGKSVRLEADPGGDDRDKYHRLLRYAYLPDGTFYNQYMVQQGYAFAYTVFPNSKLEQFRGWEREAREANRGLWAGCNINESSQIKQTTGSK
jgi:micrococcal nuclease